MDERSNPSYPIPADRMENVLGYIQEHGSVQIKELARQFHVSESTIRTHTRRIFEKTCIHSKQELIDLVDKY